MNPERAVDKYLQGYAESAIACRPSLRRTYRYVACIPACDEGESLVPTLHSLSAADAASEALVVVVINGRKEAPFRVHRANHACAATLRQLAHLPPDPVAEGQFRGMGVVLVDRFSESRWIPQRQGVGLARKIAADLALAWMRDGSIGGPWIRSTDADVCVPADYWTQPATVHGDHSAVTYPFVHERLGDPLQRRAMNYYEAYLHYYVDGLRRAGSPYAFYTVGSLLAIRGEAYAKVRGFPRRLAGEDFYILNKLAKVGRVGALSGAPLRLSGRTSDRVPFGTGVAVAQIREGLANGRPYEVYHPDVFIALKCWLNALETAIGTGTERALETGLAHISSPLGDIIRRAVHRVGFVEPLKKALRDVRGQVLRKRVHDWHDGFRTLKLVHALRDEGLGTVAADEVLTTWM